MVECPECSAEIEYSVYGESISTEYYFTVDNEGFGKYVPITEDIYANDIYYRCPVCGAVLCFNELEATDFLTETGGKKCTK